MSILTKIAELLRGKPPLKTYVARLNDAINAAHNRFEVTAFLDEYQQGTVHGFASLTLSALAGKKLKTPHLAFTGYDAESTYQVLTMQIAIFLHAMALDFDSVEVETLTVPAGAATATQLAITVCQCDAQLFTFLANPCSPRSMDELHDLVNNLNSMQRV